MPNHCLCKLIIGGDSAEDALIFFRTNADPTASIDPKQPGLSFEEAVPYPEGTCRRSLLRDHRPERPPTT